MHIAKTLESEVPGCNGANPLSTFPTPSQGEEVVSLNEEDIETHRYASWSTSNCEARPVAVVTPQTTEQVSRIAKICSKYKVPMSKSHALNMQPLKLYKYAIGHS